MQAKDVDEAAVLEGIRACNEARCDQAGEMGHGALFRNADGSVRGHWQNRWDLGRLLPDVPEKVLLAKLRSMMKRKLITGCPCGCRGDLEVVPADKASS